MTKPQVVLLARCDAGPPAVPSDVVKCFHRDMGIIMMTEKEDWALSLELGARAFICLQDENGDTDVFPDGYMFDRRDNYARDRYFTLLKQEYRRITDAV